MTTTMRQRDWRTLGLEGLSFFGRVSASISHEIKNSLAILNEQAGIIADMVLLAEKGGQVRVERLKSLSGNMQAQVKRADAVVKSMNAFAHSVDSAEAEVDTARTAALVVTLSSRLATNKGVSLAFEEPGRTHMVRTSPFFLENLLFLLLWRAVEGADARKTVRVAVEEEPGAALVRLEGLEPAAVPNEPGEQEARLAGLLGASVRTDPAAGSLSLVLPAKPALRLGEGDN